jgi:hypothetical protein
VASKENPDRTLRGTTDNEDTKAGWTTVISIWSLIWVISAACIGGSWAIATEIHNYRLIAITHTLETVSEDIREIRDNGATRDRRIDRNDTMITTFIEQVSKKLDEITRHLEN